MCRSWRAFLAGTALAVASGSALAQALVPADPDWREAEAPPPPALSTDRLVEIDMPQSQLRFGVDPASVTVGADRIVRYVVVATSRTGAVNASYEGIRCSTGEFKVYARHNPDSGWVRAQDEWRSLHDSSLRSRHSLAVARGGACMGHGTGQSPEQIVRDLRAGVDTRFRPERR